MRTILKAAACAVALSVGVLATAPAAQAQVVAPVKKVGPVLTVKWSAVGIIGVAGVLVGYDMIRRFGCTGDFLNLGGPGFDSSARNLAVMPPRCAPAR